MIFKKASYDHFKCQLEYVQRIVGDLRMWRMQPSKCTGESHETKAYMSLCKTFKITIKMV